MLILGISDDVQISGHANAEGGKQRLAFVRIGNESFIADRILLIVIYLSMASPETGHFTCGSLRPLSQNILGSRFHHRAAFAACGGRSGHSEAGGHQDSWHYLHFLLLRSKDTHIRLLWLPSFAA